MKRGAGSVSVVAFVLLFVAFFVFYLLWVQPEERRELLGQEIFQELPGGGEEEGEGMVKPSNQILSTTVGIIGKQMGDISETVSFDDQSMRWPRSSETLAMQDRLFLESSVLGSGVYTYTVGSVDKTLDNIRVSFKMGEVKGEPIVRVGVGETYYASSAAQKDTEYSAVIPAASLVQGDQIRVVCEFGGWKFWTKDSCELKELLIEKVVYNQEHDSMIKSFDMSGWAGEDGSIKFYFKSNTTQDEGKLTIRINDVKIYEGNPETSEYIFEKTTGDVGLVRGTNTLRIETGKGGYYELFDLKLEVWGVSTARNNKTIPVTVTDDVYSKARGFLITFELEQILSSGALEISLYPAKVTKYLGPEDLFEGTLQVALTKDQLKKGTNKLELFSTTGKFNIGSLIVSYE